MNTLSLIILAALVLILVAFMVLLPVAIIFNVRAAAKYRQGLATQVDKLRLGRMLSALGIDINEYLNTERAIDIHTHMERCSACANTDECDEKLAGNDIDPERINFCNNEASLQEMVRKPD
jgi:hypothetical protein